MKNCVSTFYDRPMKEHGIAVFNFDCQRSTDIYAAIDGTVKFRPSAPSTYVRRHEFEIRGQLDGAPTLVRYRFWTKRSDLSDSLTVTDGQTVRKGERIGRFAPEYINSGEYLYLVFGGAAVGPKARDWFD